MQTSLPAALRADEGGREAEAVLRRCVHCGFCNSACPTYLHTGDERKGPRGRIYQMKSFLEGGDSDAQNLQNLDLCLSCQACESACPSGVEYLKLLDFARPQMARAAARPPLMRLRRKIALFILLKPALLRALLACLRPLRALLPPALAAYAPRRAPPPAPAQAAAADAPKRASASQKRAVLFDGCVQSAVAPATNAKALAVLAKAGIAAAETRAFCCGALELHLEKTAAAKERIRANVDILHGYLERGFDYVVSTASGCGRVIADYGRILADDAAYAARARRVAEAHRDIAEVLDESGDLAALSAPAAAAAGGVAFHCPCTLKHGLKREDAAAAIFARLGIAVKTAADGGHCCGSAGFYSLENPHMARRLRDDRLRALAGAEVIVTANIGCQLHLQSGTKTPVKHWLELIET